ncbi:MAG: hypothetical protein ACK5JT_05915 [Hyphomicrobiaceae bacterium]
MNGVPALIVATTAFTQAADVQSKALGYQPNMIWVPHPIQDRTDAELEALADENCDRIIEAMTSQG